MHGKQADIILLVYCPLEQIIRVGEAVGIFVGIALDGAAVGLEDGFLEGLRDGEFVGKTVG